MLILTPCYKHTFRSFCISLCRKSFLSGDCAASLPGNSCLPSFKELPARAGTLGYHMLSDEVGHENRAAPGQSSTELQQISPEKLISHEIRRLIVRLFVDVFDLRANKLPGGSTSSIPLNSYCRSTRHDPILLTKYPPNQPAGVVCDKGKA